MAVAEIVDLRGEPVELLKIIHQEFQSLYERWRSAGALLDVSDEAVSKLATIPINAIHAELTANSTLRGRLRSYPTDNDRVSARDWARVLRLFAESDGSPKAAVRAWIDVFCHEPESERGFMRSICDWFTGGRRK
ncbi:MAG: hypothetical protein OXC91_00765 [Rhodobacteraceae bacterium]|nr:hypothetical protein [Paracoccaceae bacterium]